MPVHFTNTEMTGRRARAAQSLANAGADALLLFKQESMFYLTGYDT
jgi:Xaa-Pro dipeptidase